MAPSWMTHQKWCDINYSYHHGGYRAYAKFNARQCNRCICKNFGHWTVLLIGQIFYLYVPQHFFTCGFISNSVFNNKNYSVVHLQYIVFLNNLKNISASLPSVRRLIISDRSFLSELWRDIVKKYNSQAYSPQVQLIIWHPVETHCKLCCQCQI